MNSIILYSHKELTYISLLLKHFCKFLLQEKNALHRSKLISAAFPLEITPFVFIYEKQGCGHEFK